MKQKTLFIILLLCFTAVSIPLPGGDEGTAIRLMAEKGRVDFQGKRQVESEPVPLNGEWEFYWNQLLMPEHFERSERLPVPTDYVDLPRYWNGLTVDGSELPGQGYATFRLTVDHIIPYRILFIHIPVINSAFRLYANGSFVGQCGAVATHRGAAQPRRCTESFGYYLDQEHLSLIIQISNHHHQQGGIWQAITLADYQIDQNAHFKRLSIDLFLIGALLIMGLYYLGVFQLRRKERSTLFFGLFCLTMTLRTSFHNSVIFLELFPLFSWEAYITLDYLTLTIPLILFVTFLKHLYPEECSRRIYQLVVSISLLLTLFTLSAPTVLFTRFLTVYQIVILLSGVYIIWVMLKALKRGRNGSKEMLVGVLILIATAVNDILYAQALIDSVFIIGYGLLIFILSQSYVLTKRFTNALRTSEELSLNLEMKVKDQTSEIRDLLDNTGQGILSFDRDFTIQQHASRSTFHVFEKSVHGENVIELMFPERKEEIAACFDILFQSGGKMNLVRDLLPTEFVKNDRSYELSFRWIPAGKKTPDRVMVIMTDVTVKRKLEKMLEKDELRNQKIIRIAVDRHGFLRFYNRALEDLDRIGDLLEASPLQAFESIDVARRLHTMKGGMAGYSFSEVAERIHEAEKLLNDRDNQSHLDHSDSTNELNRQLKEIRKRIHEEIMELGDLVPRQLLNVANIEFYNISEEKIDRLEAYIHSKGCNHPELTSIIRDLRKQPLRNLLRKTASDAKHIAFQLGKQIEVFYSGEETQIIHAPLDGFLVNLVHLVRNAVHHGIETPSERKGKGKPENGRLEVQIRHTPGLFEMTFSDDGRGIDVEKIKRKALETKLLSAVKIDALSHEETMQLIFEPGFTTRNDISAISGRGIGMSAVAESINELGGTISIDSEPDRGTRFTINIPVFF